jgi:hypothetical protein
MAPRKPISSSTSTYSGMAPKSYLENRAGNYWLSKNSGTKESDAAGESDDSYMRRTADNTRKMQLKDQTKSASDNAAGSQGWAPLRKTVAKKNRKTSTKQ